MDDVPLTHRGHAPPRKTQNKEHDYIHHEPKKTKNKNNNAIREEDDKNQPTSGYKPKTNHQYNLEVFQVDLSL